MDQSFDAAEDAFEKLIFCEYQEEDGYFEEIDQFVLNVLSEIDGDRKGYEEFLMLLATNPTPQEVRHYMDSPA